MASLVRVALTTLTLTSYLLHAVTPLAQARELSRAEYEGCQSRDEAGFRAAVETITTEALRKGLAGIDYVALVGDEWRRTGLDEVIDRRVDAVIAEVRNETSTWDRLRSNVSSDTAKQLAEKVAERVYRSDAVKAGIEALTVGVAREVGKSIELATEDAAEPALACLQAFLGPRYGTAVARAVSADASREFGLGADKGTAEISAGSVLRNSAEGIAGAAILLVRRQIANITARIGQRLVGTVLSRLVAIAADGVGLVLIAKDLWDLSGGVFPIIQNEMKSQNTKSKVREELAKVIGDQIGEHTKEIGTKTADRVVEIWQEFRRAHTKVLDLAERNASFKSLVDSVPTQSLPRLDEVVALVSAVEGEAGLMKRLGDGSLAEAVNKMPVAAMDIAREMRSLEAGLGWAAIAGDDLKTVVAYEVYRRAHPQDFTKASLRQLLSVGDRLATMRLAALDRPSREALLELEAADVKLLARSLTESELASLARYLTGLQKEPREMILKHIAAAPARMQALATPRIREGILTSRDQKAAVEMMLRAEPFISLTTLGNDYRAAWEGRINPALVIEKHPGSLVAAAAMSLLLLLLMVRLVRPRRARAPA